VVLGTFANRLILNHFLHIIEAVKCAPAFLEEGLQALYSLHTIAPAFREEGLQALYCLKHSTNDFSTYNIL
jgi:hypothetical protein